MKREIIHVHPVSDYLAKYKAPVSAVTRYGDMIYVSGCPPFDPATGQIAKATIERQTEIVLEQMKLCLEAAGSSLEGVLKCNIYCTSADKFDAVNAVYIRYFQKDPLLECSRVFRYGLARLTSRSTASPFGPAGSCLETDMR
jgi:2-iminobutanoate/2-iminopropanoate deaminase